MFRNKVRQSTVFTPSSMLGLADEHDCIDHDLINLIPFTRNDHFVDREEFSQGLLKLLPYHASGQAAIWGLGGCGYASHLLSETVYTDEAFLTTVKHKSPSTTRMSANGKHRVQ